MSSLLILGDTSGSVLLQAPAIAGSTTLTLPAKTGTVLTNTSSGAVIQTVFAQDATPVTTTTNNSTYINTSISATITPSSTASRILILIMARVQIKTPSNGESGMGFAIKRNGTSVFQDASGYMGFYTNNNVNTYWNNTRATMPCNYVDSPASTSALTYTFCINSYLGVSTVNTDGQTSTIILQEIAG
jgi:hypothetical protein